MVHMDVMDQVRADRDKLRARQERLLAEAAELDPKLAELNAAVRVWERYSTTHTNDTPYTNDTTSGDDTVFSTEAEAETDIETPDRSEVREDRAEQVRPERGRQKELIIAALADQPHVGKTVADIQEWIRLHHGMDVTSNTVSVTLPRLRGPGISRLEGRHWFYGPSNPGDAAGEL